MTYPGPAVFQCPGPVVDVILGILGRVVAYPVPDLESWPPSGCEVLVRIVQYGFLGWFWF